jgi:hypothetical protein
MVLASASWKVEGSDNFDKVGLGCERFELGEPEIIGIG